MLPDYQLKGLTNQLNRFADT